MSTQMNKFDPQNYLWIGSVDYSPEPDTSNKIKQYLSNFGASQPYISVEARKDSSRKPSEYFGIEFQGKEWTKLFSLFCTEVLTLDPTARIVVSAYKSSMVIQTPEPYQIEVTLNPETLVPTHKIYEAEMIPDFNHKRLIEAS